MFTITVSKRSLLSWILVAILIIIALVVAACSTPDTNDQDFVNKQQDWYRKYQAIHFYTYSLELSIAQQIYDARNEARNTHSYAFAMIGKILFDCPSRGFPIPYGVQLTNPLKPADRYGAVIAQAEPSGLYTTGITTNATWIQCARKIKSPTSEVIGSETASVYSEPEVMAFPFPVVERDGRLYDLQDTPSSVKIDLTRPSNIPMKGPDGLDPNVLVK